MLESLASYHHCLDRLRTNWPTFVEKRRARLAEEGRHGTVAEKVAENILEDLFTAALDWELSDLDHQVGYADLLLTRLGVKYLLVEVKRPGALAWHRRAVEQALDQARRYAAEQHVSRVAVSDGVMLYAADVAHGGLCDRVFARLDLAEPDETLWWLSVHGIYRPRDDTAGAAPRLLPEPLASVGEPRGESPCDEALLHPKYDIPSRCFAYVGRADAPHTWKLPYLLADGTIDHKRLPKAVQAILSNYRGAKVGGIPEVDIPDVLVRLARAAAAEGKMPGQTGEPAPVYVQLAEALEQVGRLGEVD
jgi:hypothetical protein